MTLERHLCWSWDVVVAWNRALYRLSQFNLTLFDLQIHPQTQTTSIGSTKVTQPFGWFYIMKMTWKRNSITYTCGYKEQLIIKCFIIRPDIWPFMYFSPIREVAGSNPTQQTSRPIKPFTVHGSKINWWLRSFCDGEGKAVTERRSSWSWHTEKWLALKVVIFLWPLDRLYGTTFALFF